MFTATPPKWKPGELFQSVTAPIRDAIDGLTKPNTGTSNAGSKAAAQPLNVFDRAGMVDIPRPYQNFADVRQHPTEIAIGNNVTKL